MLFVFFCFVFFFFIKYRFVYCCHNNHTGRWLSQFRATWHPKREDMFVVGSVARPRMVSNIFYFPFYCCLNIWYINRHHWQPRQRSKITFYHLTLNTVEFVQSDTWVFRQPAKIYGPKVFLLSKINLSIPTSCTICNNFVCLLAYYWMENHKSLQHFYQTIFEESYFPLT
jgi:hypothetical protein